LRGLIFDEIQSAVDELPPEQREVFELTEYYDMPVKELQKIPMCPIDRNFIFP
jgi:DNA-directed RNA polymerase specialized sigma24 family protein